MQNITYAYLGPDDAAAKFAKKGTASDVTLFNAKLGETLLNIVTPSRYPEKLMSLLIALDLADAIVLHPSALDRQLGETVVGAELFGRTRGFARAGPNVSTEQLRQVLSRTSLKTLKVTDEADATLRERLYTETPAGGGGPTVVPVDHSFPVKGVGTVALGLVRSGEVTAHATLQAYPTTKTAEVRSIQVHDVDVKAAPTRSRVGLALKGIEAEELPRGRILAPPGSLEVLPAQSKFTFDVTPHPFSKWTPRPGVVLHLFHVLQDVVLRVEAVEGASPLRITGQLEGPLAKVPEQPAVLVDLDNKLQRFVGRVRLPG